MASSRTRCRQAAAAKTTGASAPAAPIALTKRFRVDGEVSDGDLGPGGKIGTNFPVFRADQSVPELCAGKRADGQRPARARRGNLVSGVKTRLSDSASIYLEERYQDTDRMTGLTHATGINLAANERWNFGASAELGTLRDSLTGAETDRKAADSAWAMASTRCSSRARSSIACDDAEQPDMTHTERTAWLFRNNFKFQLDAGLARGRQAGPLDSDSSLGEFYDGGYTEAVVGYAYRPVRHDRLNALTKYTYFYNVPTTDQVTLQNTRGGVHPEEPHRGARSDLRPHGQLVDRRQVRLPPGTGEP